VIRRAALKDIPAIAALEERCFTTDVLAASDLRRLLRRGHGMFVDVHRGLLRGYALVIFRARTSIGRIYTFAVDPAARGQGVGRRLLIAMERETRRRGRTRVSVEANPRNRAARRVYEGRGFQICDFLPGFYEDGTDALKLMKVLK
jgi:ribosomal protein S18 acetylase RimI-like enzyme